MHQAGATQDGTLHVGPQTRFRLEHGLLGAEMRLGHPRTRLCHSHRHERAGPFPFFSKGSGFRLMVGLEKGGCAKADAARFLHGLLMFIRLAHSYLLGWN